MLWALEQPTYPPQKKKKGGGIKRKRKASKQTNENIFKRFRSLMLWILEQHIKTKHSHPPEKKKKKILKVKVLRCLLKKVLKTPVPNVSVK